MSINRSKPIPFDYAAQLIYNFLNELPLNGISNMSIGGTFPANDFFSFTQEFIATQLWFCFNPLDTGLHPELFLAVEKVKHAWDPKNIPDTPANEFLQRPLNTFRFPSNLDRTKLDVVKTFLMNHQDGNSPYMQDISRGFVKRYAGIYKSLFGDNAENYCKHPLGYFVAEGQEGGKSQPYFREFLKPDTNEIKHVRYYFGYENRVDPEFDDKPNRIRIVLFPVDSNGKNIVVLPDPENKIEASVILQKSFPPPPYE